ncbi:MAG: hypothetical protein JJV89_03440 [Desulfosarcina sp.]|nr:hypothetical protein [Desulfobacterales bacterium]
MADTPIQDVYVTPQSLNIPFANIHINEGPKGQELIFSHEGRWYRQYKVLDTIVLQANQIRALQSQTFELNEIEDITSDYPLSESKE